jgi:hypothetical protein
MRHLPLLLARSVLFSGRPGPLSWSGAGGFGGGMQLPLAVGTWSMVS